MKLLIYIKEFLNEIINVIDPWFPSRVPKCGCGKPIYDCECHKIKDLHEDSRYNSI